MLSPPAVATPCPSWSSGRLTALLSALFSAAAAYMGPDNKLLSWKELGTNALVETLAGKLPVERVHIHLTCAPRPEADD